MITEKEWDEDLDDLLRGLMLKGYLKGKIQADNPKKYTLNTNKAKREWKIIKNHYKHQKSEMLKRLSEIKIQNAIDIWIHENGLGYYNKIPTFKEYNKLAKAIHALVDIKLKEEK